MRASQATPGVLLIAVAATAWLAACAPATRYRALSLVFDGVPVPEGVEPRGGPPEPETPFASSRTRTRPMLVVATPTPLPTVYAHEPWRTKRCRECHVVNGVFKPGEFEPTLCDKCHYEQRTTEGWDHGPINLGTCLPCHEAHFSYNEHLLSQPVPQLCLICHQDDLARPEEYHQVANINACTECHSPHRTERTTPGTS